MTCYFSGRPNADFFVGIAHHVALAYSTVVIATNVLCTTLICGRILWIRRKMEASGVGGGAAKASRRRFGTVPATAADASIEAAKTFWSENIVDRPLGAGTQVYKKFKDKERV